LTHRKGRYEPITGATYKLKGKGSRKMTTQNSQRALRKGILEGERKEGARRVPERGVRRIQQRGDRQTYRISTNTLKS